MINKRREEIELKKKRENDKAVEQIASTMDDTSFISLLELNEYNNQSRRDIVQLGETLKVALQLI